MRLGIDIGRVIMCPASDDGAPDSSFLDAKTEEEAMAVPPAPFMFEVVPELVERTRSLDEKVTVGGLEMGNAAATWLISKVKKERIIDLTQKWLDHHKFFERTGISPTRVIFCPERSDKSYHASKLRLTHFIDDRIDVLKPMKGIVPHLILFGPQHKVPPEWMARANNWLGVKALLERTWGQT